MEEPMMPTKLMALVLAVVAGVATPAAQIHQGPFTEVFPPEEFALRRARLLEKIGDGVAGYRNRLRESLRFRAHRDR